MSTGADYLERCDRYGGGMAKQARWSDLAELFNLREGWYFTVENTGSGKEALWCYGLDGAGLIVVYPDDVGFFALIHDKDSEHRFATVQELDDWLPPHEERLEGHTSLQNQS